MLSLGSGERPGVGGPLFVRLVDVRPEEVRPALWAAFYFFSLLAAYYVLRPVRDEMGVAGGVRNLPWLFTGTLAVMLAVNPSFSALVARWPRTRFIPAVYRFFAAQLLVFWVVLRIAPSGSANVWAGRVLFVWTAVFNLFVVSVFWGFVVDLFTSEQGKRLFGLIAFGGTAGALAGAGLTAVLARPLGPPQLLLFSVLLLEGAVFAARRLSRLAVPGRAASGAATGEAERPLGGGAWAGVGHMARSPYLLGIAAYMLLYTVTSTFLYFQQAEIAARSFADRGSRTEFFAEIDVAVNALTVVAQLFLTGRILRLLGVALTLTLLPLLTVAGFAWLGVYPVLLAVVVFQVLRRAGNFAVARPAREVLYTVVPREDKYKAKSLLDTFVYRAGDQIGAWAYALLSGIGLGLAAIAWVGVPLAGLWASVGFWLGRRQGALSGERVAVAAALPPAAGEVPQR